MGEADSSQHRTRTLLRREYLVLEREIHESSIRKLIVVFSITAQALLTLNSCPMFTYNERDLHRMPTPTKSHLPVKDFIAASGILDDENSAASSTDADVALLRLPAPSLRGTFAKAYVLLAKLVSQIGWDELLKCRSQVFVMEEEYRMHRAQDMTGDSPMAPPKDGEGDDESVKEGFGPLAIATDEESDAGSIRRSDDNTTPTQSTVTGTNASATAPTNGVPIIAVNGETSDGEQVVPDSDNDEDGQPGIPTIKVSTESDGEREREELKKFEASEEGRKAREEIEKPGQAKQDDDDAAAQDKEVADDQAAASKEGGANGLENKRLCERWLDNLFMVLYEVSAAMYFPFPSLSRVLTSFLCARTCGCTRSGEPRLRTSRRNISRTARPEPSGRSSENSLNVFTTRRSRRTRSSAPSTRSSRQRRGSSCSRCTPTRETCNGA